MAFMKNEQEHGTSTTFVELKLTNVDRSEGALISDSDMAISQWVTFTFLCKNIDVFGIVTNINFEHSFVTTYCLAVYDLGCLLPLVWTNICLTPAVIAADLPFDPVKFQYLTGGWPHVTFTHISAWMTALISLERCLCVAAPLKVKSLLTPRRVAVVTMCVFTVFIASLAPVYIVSGLSLKFSPARNRTILGLVFTENRHKVEAIFYVICNICVSFIVFLVIILCTIVLAVKLKTNTKWRSKSTKNTLSNNVLNRNTKAAKMVVMISTLFIVCFIPIVIVFVSMMFEPEISIQGKYRNLGFLFDALCAILEFVNSSMNIFIYYYISSRYRTTFLQLFYDNKKE